MALRRRIRRSRNSKSSSVEMLAGVNPGKSGRSEKVEKRLADYGERIMEGLKQGADTLQSVSRYELIRELGEGGMGTVFLASHISEGDIRKEVAIKVLKDIGDQSALEKFIEEARLLANLSQGNIVELLALESMEITLPAKGFRPPGSSAPKSKLYFMVMEFVNGPSLEQVLRQHSDDALMMHPPMVGFVVSKAAIALAEAHSKRDENDRPLNLVHRDISPSNILFNAKIGITKLADFGVAKAFAGEIAVEHENGKLVGKLRYMSPEQLDGSAIAASDVWGLGVIAYEALTGFSPYRIFGKTSRQRVKALKMQFEYDLKPPKEILRSSDKRFNLEVISDIVMMCLEPTPGNRPTASELDSMLTGRYLYSQGLGPTNKTLASYLNMLEYSAGDGAIIPDPGFDNSEMAKVFKSTFWLDEPLQCYQRRSTSAYTSGFVEAVKQKEHNPALRRSDNKYFMPVA